MIYDHRTYVCRYGALKRQIALYEQYGFPVQTRHLGRPVLFAVTEIGDVNAYVHIWAYQDLADRAVKRAALAADPAWRDYLSRSEEAANVISQTNQILSDAPFMIPNA